MIKFAYASTSSLWLGVLFLGATAVAQADTTPWGTVTNLRAEAGGSGYIAARFAPASGFPSNSYTVCAEVDGGVVGCTQDVYGANAALPDGIVINTRERYSNWPIGTTFTITVAANNGDFHGTTIKANPVTTRDFGPPVIPPIGVSVAPGLHALHVSFQQPYEPPNSNAITYTVRAVSGSDTASCTAYPFNLACAITGLPSAPAGKSYSVVVTPSNREGTGPVSATASGTVWGLPTAPPGFVAARLTGNRVQLSWSASIDSGNTVTGYTVYNAAGAQVCNTPAGTRTCTAADIHFVPDSSTTLTVTATGQDGSASAPTTSNAVTPTYRPDAPTQVTATRTGYGTAQVSWTAPAFTGTGGFLQSYTVSASGSTATCTATQANANQNAPTTCTVKGLPNNADYTFTVKANSGGNISNASTASNSVNIPALTLPTAPTAMTAVNGAEAVTLSWQALATFGGDTSVTYTASVASGPTAASCTVKHPGKTCTLSGLTVGQNYTFSVRAANSLGAGSASTPSAALSVATRPNAPVVTGSAVGRTITFSWPAGGDNNSPILSYSVDNEFGPIGAVTAPDTSFSFLSFPGTPWTVTVTATNALGTSAPSAPATASVGEVPNPPTSISLTAAGTRGARVSWSVPTVLGNGPTTYTATLNPGNLTCTVPADSLECTFKGLGYGTYSATVRTNDPAGNSAAAPASGTLTFSGKPGVPASVTASKSGDAAIVSWTAPSDSGSALTQFVVHSVEDTTQTCVTAANVNSCTIGNLALGYHTFVVKAKNANGFGDLSSPSPAVANLQQSDAPGNFTLTPGTGSITFSWTAPAFTGGGPVRGYRVFVINDFNTTCSSGSTPLSCTISGLEKGVLRTYSIVAVTDFGDGKRSFNEPGMPLALPDAPSFMNAVTNEGQVSFNWGPAAANNLEGILHFVVKASPGGDSCIAPAFTRNCTIPSLVRGTTYTFAVMAVTAVGSSPYSTPSDPVTLRGAPYTPTNIKASVVPGIASMLDISWTAPSDGGYPITGYEVYPVGVTPELQPHLKSCSSVNSAVTTCRVGGLNNQTQYSYQVRAMNSAGAGVLSAASAPLSPADVPGRPENIVLKSRNNALAVSWDAAADNGSPILRYTATASGGAACVSDTTGGLATPAPGCTVTGLTNGTLYSVTVTATNASGTGSESFPTSARPSEGVVPEAPTIDSVQSFTAQLRPYLQGSASDVSRQVTRYRVYVEGDTTKFCEPFINETPKSCLLSELNNGQYYRLYAVAINDAGQSPRSAVFTPVPPATVPGSPILSALLPGDASMTVSWTAPVDTGGASILKYEAFIEDGFNPQTGSTEYKKCTADTGKPVVNSCTITGLVNGRRYMVQATATNRMGTSPARGDMSATVGGAPVISAPTLLDPLAMGARVRIRVKTTGIYPMRLVWYHRWLGGSEIVRTRTIQEAPLNGESYDTLTVNALSLADTGSYQIIAYNEVNANWSMSEIFHVAFTPPSILTQPLATQTVALGDTARLGVSMAGQGPFVYSWYKLAQDTVLLKRDTSMSPTDTLRFKATATDSAGTFACHIKNAFGEILTDLVRIRIGTPAGIQAVRMQALTSIRARSGEVTFELPAGAASGRATIVDLRGRALWSAALGGGSRSASRGTANLGAGMHTLRLELFDAQGRPLGALSRRFVNTP